MAGYCIPEKVIAVCRPSEVYTRTYTGEKIRVRPTFVVDAESDKMLSTAQSWARGGQYGKRHDPKDIDCLPHANDVMREIRLVGVDHRREGGLAYKVVTPQGYLVDLREDEFLEALFSGRMTPDGTIVGEYVWSRGGSQMRIVRVGSKLYQERKEAGRRSSRTKIPAKGLKVGHRYRGKDPNAYHDTVFIGRVRYQGKLMFAWRSYYGKGRHGGLQSHVEVTQGHSYVEDLGMCPGFDMDSPLKGVQHYSRGGYSDAPFDSADLEWP
jgi:hypothetical protein